MKASSMVVWAVILVLAGGAVWFVGNAQQYVTVQNWGLGIMGAGFSWIVGCALYDQFSKPRKRS